MNIVSNAFKFTQKGTVEVRVSQRPAANGHSQISFDIKDTGPGISEGQMSRLFQLFSQADSTIKRQFGGTGLGLILSRKLAQLLGGDVILRESVVGQGSTFNVTVDSGVVEASRGARRDNHECPSANSLDLANLEILLADDVPDNQVLVGSLLTLAGAKVETVSNGLQAIEKARLRTYDALLMDLQMPLMDGYEATTTLRKEGYLGPIIALTAHALHEERLRCLANGFSAHVSKPIDRRSLLETIAHHCNSSARKSV